MNNKTEQITGYLCKTEKEWIVRSPYGQFPISSALLAKVQTEGDVVAVVTHGIVTEYHFCSPFSDTPPTAAQHNAHPKGRWS